MNIRKGSTILSVWYKSLISVVLEFYIHLLFSIYHVELI